jgi:multidrug efflux pump subunit AcrA (membrane-fusion protein)
MLKDTRTIMDKNDSLLLASIDTSGRSVWALGRLSGVALAAGLLFFSGCSSKEASEEAPTVTVQVGAAENQKIERTVNADATLYPRDQAAIVPKISAPVKKFYVDKGSPVKALQLLAELEDQDMVGANTGSQGEYVQAKANYDSVVQKADQDLKLAKQELDSQQKVFDGRQSLYAQGAVSAKDVEDARTLLIQARNQYDLAQKQFDLKVAEGQLTAARGKTASSEAQLSYAKIVSPIDGVVTDRSIYPGETAPAGAPILTVMDLSQVIARAHISQQEAAQLRIGNPATISVPGQGGGDIHGKVTLVSPALDPSSTTIEVWVEAANPGGRLKAGTSVRVAIVAQTVAHAIVAPAAALLTDPDGVISVIALDTDNKPHKQHVKVGIRNGDDVQITDGLKGGERVVTVGAFELDKEDPDVLAKTKIQVQAPKMPEEEEEQ